MKIGAIVPYYQCIDELQRCVNSLRDFDLILGIDGRFPHFPGDSLTSTDGSPRLIMDLPNGMNFGYPEEQVIKRNFALDKAVEWECDYVLIMDSDSYITKLDFDHLKVQLMDWSKYPIFVFNVDYYITDKYHSEWAYVFKPNEIEYAQLHNLIRFKNYNGQLLLPDVPAPLLKDITIKTDTKLRTKEHIQNMVIYKEWKKAYESKTRERLGYVHYIGNQS